MSLFIYVYIIGAIIALLLGIILLLKEDKNNPELQPGMLCPMVLLSWFSVCIILWKCEDKILS